MMQELFVCHGATGVTLTGNAKVDRQRLDTIYQDTEPGAEFRTNLASESEEIKPDWGSAYAGILQVPGARPAPTVNAQLDPDEYVLQEQWPPEWRNLT